MMEPSLKKVNSLFGFVYDCELSESGASFDFGHLRKVVFLAEIFHGTIGLS